MDMVMHRRSVPIRIERCEANPTDRSHGRAVIRVALMLIPEGVTPFRADVFLMGHSTLCLLITSTSPKMNRPKHPRLTSMLSRLPFTLT
jgi:hypothetical protein